MDSAIYIASAIGWALIIMCGIFLWLDRRTKRKKMNLNLNLKILVTTLAIGIVGCAIKFKPYKSYVGLEYGC